MPLTSNFDINTPPKYTWVQQKHDLVTLGATMLSAKNIATSLLFLACTVGFALGSFFLSTPAQTSQPGYPFAMGFIGLLFVLGLYSLFTTLFGKIEFKIDAKNLHIHSSLFFAKKKKIPLPQIKNITISKASNNSYSEIHIHQKGNKTKKLAKALPLDRQQYLLNALLQVMEDKKTGKNSVAPIAIDWSNHLIE